MTTTAYVDLDATHNPTAGTSPTVPWGDGINSNVRGLYIPAGAKCHMVAAVSCANVTITPLTFGAASEDRDTDGFHSTASNTSRFTVPAGLGGIYDCRGWIQFAANTTGDRLALIRVDGATRYDGAAVKSATVALTTDATVCEDITLAAGQYVELCGYQNAGGALSATDFRFSLRRVAVS